MTLKHQWTPRQQEILEVLKKLLPICRNFAVEQWQFVDFMLFLRETELRCGREKELYQLWEDVCRFNSEPSRHDNPFLFEHLLCYGAASMFFNCDLVKKGSSGKVYELCELFWPPDKGKVTLPHLPERLQDHALRAAIDGNDTARVIFLYSSAAVKGAKLKNMFNIMLNKRAYKMAGEVHAVCGGLELFDAETLWLHRIMLGNDDETLFADHVDSLELPEKLFIWEKFKDTSDFPKMMIRGLKHGLSPDLPVWKSRQGDSISLRDWACFLDELNDQIDELYQTYKNDFWTIRRKVVKLEGELRLAKTFVLWEKENGK